MKTETTLKILGVMITIWILLLIVSFGSPTGEYSNNPAVTLKGNLNNVYGYGYGYGYDSGQEDVQQSGGSGGGSNYQFGGIWKTNKKNNSQDSLNISSGEMNKDSGILTSDSHPDTTLTNQDKFVLTTMILLGSFIIGLGLRVYIKSKEEFLKS